MALRLGRVQNRFDAPAQSGSGFRLRLPKGREDAQNCRCVDFIYGTGAKWRSQIGEGRAPLRPVLFVAPSAFLCGNQRIRDGAERRNSRFDYRGLALHFDRVFPCCHLLPGVTRLVSCLGK